MKRVLSALVLSTIALPVWAMTAVTDKSEFLSLVSGKDLTTRQMLVRITLQVLGDGTITGSALGSKITGTWSWQDGYFCREMDWGGTAIPYNCQLVEWDGTQMRFTVDRGAGESADFRLR